MRDLKKAIVAIVAVCLLCFGCFASVADAQCPGGSCGPQIQMGCPGGVCNPQMQMGGNLNGWGGQDTAFKIQYPTPVRSLLFGDTVRAAPQYQPQYPSFQPTNQTTRQEPVYIASPSGVVQPWQPRYLQHADGSLTRLN